MGKRGENKRKREKQKKGLINRRRRQLESMLSVGDKKKIEKGNNDFSELYKQVRKLVTDTKSDDFEKLYETYNDTGNFNESVKKAKWKYGKSGKFKELKEIKTDGRQKKSMISKIFEQIDKENNSVQPNSILERKVGDLSVREYLKRVKGSGYEHTGKYRDKKGKIGYVRNLKSELSSRESSRLRKEIRERREAAFSEKDGFLKHQEEKAKEKFLKKFDFGKSELKKGVMKNELKSVMNEVWRNKKRKDVHEFGEYLKEHKSRYGVEYEKLERIVAKDIITVYALENNYIKGVNTDGSYILHDVVISENTFVTQDDWENYIDVVSRHSLSVIELIWNQNMSYRDAMELYLSYTDFGDNLSDFAGSTSWSPKQK